MKSSFLAISNLCSSRRFWQLLADYIADLESTAIFNLIAATALGLAKSEKVARGTIDSTANMATGPIQSKMVAPGTIDLVGDTTTDYTGGKTADNSSIELVAIKENPIRISNNSYGNFDFYRWSRRGKKIVELEDGTFVENDFENLKIFEELNGFER